MFPTLTALENLLLPYELNDDAGGSKAGVERARALLNSVGLSERVDHYPVQLSGGEQQRVAVARALINNPSIVLADEPSGNLDSENASSLHSLFIELRDRFSQTFVIVTHNEHLGEMADRKVIMKDGLIING